MRDSWISINVRRRGRVRPACLCHHLRPASPMAVLLGIWIYFVPPACPQQQPADHSKYLNQNHMPDAAGQNGFDGWQMLMGGFRSDTNLSSNDTLMFQGNIYTGNEGEPAAILPSVTSPGLANVSWRCSDRFSINFVGQNLLNDRHLEFSNDTAARSTLVKRSAFAKITWWF